ncbi:MAG: magnesium transporter MgtE N-terminal domain-containing protein [Bacteriovoracia bacterium]
MAIFEELPKSVIYVSLLQGIKILNSEGIKVGRFQDFFVDYEDIYPEVLAIQFRYKEQFFFVEWKDIDKFSYKRIVLKQGALLRTGKTYPRVRQRRVLTSLLASQFSGSTVDYPPLAKIIMDRQVVDISGKKVIRVNDIQMIRVGKNIRVTHAAVGMRSLIRRIGYEKFFMLLAKAFPFLNRILKENLINWKYVHAIPDPNVHKDVKLNLSNQELEDLHPADLADILENLDTHGREKIFNELDPETAAEVLSEVDPEMQALFLDAKDPVKAANIIARMSPDEAADILGEMSTAEADEIISNINDNEAQEEIQDLLEYEEDTAGGLMTTDYFEVTAQMTKAEIFDYFKANEEDIDILYDIYIVNEAYKLEGTTTIRDLLMHDEKIKACDIMEKDDIKSLAPDTTWKQIASYMSKYNLINVPIVDNENILLGVVSIDDVLPWILDER